MFSNRPYFILTPSTIKLFSSFAENAHVNNLLPSSAKFTEGWTTEVEAGKWKNHPSVYAKCGPQWYGWSYYADVGAISTTLSQSTKCGQLNFGNCWDAGVVRVYLNGELIGEAGPNTPSRTIQFPIPKDSLLELKDEGPNSVIKFNGFEMAACTGNVEKIFLPNLKK